MNISAELRRRFESALATLTDDPAEYAALVRPAQNTQFGDYQANCAMPLAKKLSDKPRDVAAKIVENLDVSDLCETPEIAGPGFINLKLRTDWLTEQVNAVTHDDRLGVKPVANPQTIVIDYSAPNVAKPMHVGHLRSSVIGAALYKILTFQGHKVISDNHIGDWGTQFGMIIYGYKNFLNPEAYKADAVTELARLYRLVNILSDYHENVNEKLPSAKQRLQEFEQQLADAEANSDPAEKSAKKKLKKLRAGVTSQEKAVQSLQQSIEKFEADPELKELADNHPDIARLARLETAKLHSGDEENRRLWDEFLPACLTALQKVYDRLGVSFDHTLGESFYDPMLGEVVEALEAKGLASESKGATCVFLDQFEAPFIVRKSDGAYNYATTDLATIQYRVNEFNADAMLYVVDSRQGDHFKMLFETARKWGHDKNFQHVNFGTVLGKDRRPFKTRAGDTVGLESLLDEAVNRAYQIVTENDKSKPNGPELDDATRKDVAEKVGIGGVKYADLHINRESDYVFDWDQMLATNGDTATYMQYSYARVNGIFSRGGFDRETIRNSNATIQLQEPAERELALALLKFGEAIDDAASELRPHLLTSYLFETANKYSTFYEQCSVLKSEGDVQQSRLLLCDLTCRVLQQGLALLGIETCERM
ncbi:arginine--tRNA ligase [Thalassoroseus pseudoceratinae]|uniref:arginine--tRNA ligase n=1 Tax=Thalassoroseus pseudoceratinae TaxID=2713176 RepID=UPI001423ED4C|nr:arginine--tRNA ligase [Thalassoroseus pseudoceratinae]